MSVKESNESLRTVLEKAAKERTRLRFFGPGMMIVAEGFVDFVGDGVIGIKHHEKEGADEFILDECIIKIQILPEYRHY